MCDAVVQALERAPQFQWAPTLGGECYSCSWRTCFCSRLMAGFNGHPPLGVNATRAPAREPIRPSPVPGFNGHPPLGVNATRPPTVRATFLSRRCGFNGHPPLGVNATQIKPDETNIHTVGFQWAPTLGGECYLHLQRVFKSDLQGAPRFNGHPPLGVNATSQGRFRGTSPPCFNGHPPLGVNATRIRTASSSNTTICVSMGTHPWG